MKLLKIFNWITPNGTADYKGLDIELFTPGTQVYPDDSVCYIGTVEVDIPQHADIKVITQAEYDAVVESIPSPIDPLQELKAENEAIKQSIAELTMLLATPQN